jgi:hypothetical protein
MIIPAMMCFVWFAMVGGTAIDLELSGVAEGCHRRDRDRKARLEHRALAEGVRDDLQAPALLDEQALEKVLNRYELGGADVRPWRLAVVYGATIRDRGTGSTMVRAGRSVR